MSEITIEARALVGPRFFLAVRVWKVIDGAEAYATVRSELSRAELDAVSRDGLSALDLSKHPELPPPSEWVGVDLVGE